jgi:hypothetical protein
MARQKPSKNARDIATPVRKRRKLASLVAAVGAGAALGLIGTSAANASSVPATTIEKRAESKAPGERLLLKQTGSKTQLAGGGGHASHESHASHASHSSGSYQ